MKPEYKWQPKYEVATYTADSLEHGLPETVHCCISPAQVAEILAANSIESRGIEEVRIKIQGRVSDASLARYWKHESQVRRDYEFAYRDEIAKYLPNIHFMSFIGPEATIKWLFEQVGVKATK